MGTASIEGKGTAAGVIGNRRGPAPEVVIRPPSGVASVDFREYYRYRQLFASLVRRNIRVQFGEMRLGFLWVCVRPLLYVAVFVGFRHLSSANTHVSIPYPLYIYSGLILWYYLLDSIMAATNALRKDASLLTRIYYPRLITPAVPVVANLWELGLALVPVALMMLWYKVGPGWRLLLLPFVALQVSALILGVGTIFASLALAARDWERFLSTALYLGLFVSPVIYAPEMIPVQARLVYFLNPMVGSLMAFRSTLFSPQAFPVWQWTYSVAFSVGVLLLGLRMFRAAEARFADQL